jgi:uncharacterized protein
MAFSVSKSSRPLPCPSVRRWYTCQSIGRVNTTCRLGYTSGWPASAVILAKKNQAFCRSIAPSSHAVKYLRAAAKAARSFMIYTIFKDQAGEYRWRLCAQNYIVIAISGEGYKNHKDCSDSIDLVKESSSAPVIDTTNKGSSERPRIASENLGIVGERRAGIARVLKILRQCLRLGRRIVIGVASRVHPRAPNSNIKGKPS